MSEKKFHISTSGIPAKCNADIRNCPRGGPSYHKDSYQEAMELADRINEESLIARASLDNKVNKLTDLFEKSRPLETQIKNAKKLIDNYENSLWKQAYNIHKKEEPFSNHNENSFKKEFLDNDEDYQSALKRLNKLNENKSIYIQERKDSVELVKKLRPYLRGLSFSNASGSCYFVFGTKDKEEVLTLLKENNIIIKRDNINDDKLVFAVRLADHKKHKTRFNNTKVEVDGDFNKDSYKKLKNQEMKKALLELESEQKYIAKLVGEINAIKTRK